jgi:hypothetical protein
VLGDTIKETLCNSTEQATVPVVFTVLCVCVCQVHGWDDCEERTPQKADSFHGRPIFCEV